MTGWALVGAVVAALGFGVGSVLQAVGAAGGPPWRILLRRRPYVLGQAADGVGWTCSLLAVRVLPLFVVEAILASSLGISVVLGRIVLGSRMRRVDIAAVTVVVASAAVVAGTGVRLPGHAGDGRTGLALVGCLVAVLVVLRPALRSGRSGVLALLAGVAFAGEVLAERVVRVGPGVRRSVTLLVLQPVSWVLIAFVVLGSVLYARALARGAVGAMTAIPWAVELVVPSVLGLLVLGDAVRAGWLPVTVTALLATVGATAVLATAPEPTGRGGDQ